MNRIILMFTENYGQACYPIMNSTDYSEQEKKDMFDHFKLFSYLEMEKWQALPEDHFPDYSPNTPLNLSLTWMGQNTTATVHLLLNINLCHVGIF